MADPSRGMRRRDAAFWSVCLLWLGIAVSGSHIEAVTGVPVGSGSWLGLAVFAAYTVVTYFVLPHLESEEAAGRELARHAVPPQEPETVQKALARVAARRAEPPPGGAPTS